MLCVSTKNAVKKTPTPTAVPTAEIRNVKVQKKVEAVKNCGPRSLALLSRLIFEYIGVALLGAETRPGRAKSERQKQANLVVRSFILGMDTGQDVEGQRINGGGGTRVVITIGETCT
jgi:hypothetical protein